VHPSKALLHGSELFDEAANGHFATWGITAKVDLDLGKMHAEKTKAVGELTGGIEFLFKKNKVTWLKVWRSSRAQTRFRSETRPSRPRMW
jgi:dihydrolipoamide dehydrogenase